VSYVYVYLLPGGGGGRAVATASWSDTRRTLARLQRPEEVGRIAARRAARMLARASEDAAGACRVRTAAGGGIHRRHLLRRERPARAQEVGFLGALLGKRVAAPGVTLVDDGTLEHGIATRPFDGEGVASRRTAVIEDGVLRQFLYDATTARKAKAKSTGSASRAWASLPSIGTSNFYLMPGKDKPDSIIRGVKNGLYVTAMLGRGADVVTGDYSRGANGIWIEKRRADLARPGGHGQRESSGDAEGHRRRRRRSRFPLLDRRPHHPLRGAGGVRRMRALLFDLDGTLTGVAGPGAER